MNEANRERNRVLSVEKPMNILVTGGKGTIARSLTPELIRRGHVVSSIDLAHDEHEVGFSLQTDDPTANYARCDVSEFRQLQRVFNAMGPFDLVFHLAAEFGRWNGEDFYENLWRTNAIGTKNVIRLQEQLGFRLVHASSSEVYGDWPKVMVEQVTAEEPIAQLNDYAMTKWVNEMQIRNSAAHYGTKSVVVRIFNTYGPGEYYSPYRSVNCRFIYCALHGLPYVVHRGYGRTSTYIDDTVGALAAIPEKFVPGEVYNIGGTSYHTIEELSDLVVEATGANPALVEYRHAEVLTTRHKRVDTRKAARDLGLVRPIGLREGVRNTVAWMRDTYRLPLKG